jgi:hypothetical protein
MFCSVLHSGRNLRKCRLAECRGAIKDIEFYGGFIAIFIIKIEGIFISIPCISHLSDELEK